MKQPANKSKKRQPQSRSTFANAVIDSFDDFFAAADKGKPLSVREVRLELKVPDYSPADVSRVRAQLGVSQGVFAQLLTVSPATVRAWEQGRRTPPAIARRLLEDISASPDHWRRVIAKAAVRVA